MKFFSKAEPAGEFDLQDLNNAVNGYNMRVPEKLGGESLDRRRLQQSQSSLVVERHNPPA